MSVSQSIFAVLPGEKAEELRDKANQAFADTLIAELTKLNTEANWASGFTSVEPEIDAVPAVQAKCPICSEVHQ